MGKKWEEGRTVGEEGWGQGREGGGREANGSLSLKWALKFGAQSSMQHIRLEPNSRNSAGYTLIHLDQISDHPD